MKSVVVRRLRSRIVKREDEDINRLVIVGGRVNAFHLGPRRQKID